MRYKLNPIMKVLTGIGLSLLPIFSFQSSEAQPYCVSGCNDNTFVNASDPNTLEYDNVVGLFHSTMLKEAGGGLLVWGASAKPDGSNQLSPTRVNANNGYNYQGSILKYTGGSASGSKAQLAILTTTGLYYWGEKGYLVSTTIKNNNSFGASHSIATYGQSIPYPSTGLPKGVVPEDVKQLVGTLKSLALVTCDEGYVYVLDQNGYANGDGTTLGDNKWHQVKTDDPGHPALKHVVALRATVGGYFAMTSTTDGQKLYTWGKKVYKGNGSSVATDKNYAIQMTKPASVSGGDILMIGFTQGRGNPASQKESYFLLTTGGKIFSMGNNELHELGDFTSIERKGWINVLVSSGGPVLTDVKWLTTNGQGEGTGSQIHAGFPALAAIIQNGSNLGHLWVWGMNSYNMLGSGSSNQPVDPRDMNSTSGTGLTSSDDIIATTMGGHTLIAFRKCSDKFGYIGHEYYGSMGNGAPNSAQHSSFTFSTATIDLCGASATVKITTDDGAGICTMPNNTVQVNQTGGIFSITQGSQYADINSSTGELTNITATPGDFIKVKYSTGGASCENDEITLVGCAHIYGTVYHDKDGLQDGDITQTNGNNNSGTNCGGGLNAVLYNDAGVVVAVSSVKNDGTFDLGQVPGEKYKVLITGNTALVNNPVPDADLPSGWVNTGENRGSGSGNDGTVDGILDLGIVNENQASVNFGIEKKPVAHDVTPAALPGDPGENVIFNLDGGTSPGHAPLMTGTDDEDGNYSGGNGATNNPKGIQIHSLPTNGELYYNNTLVTNGDIDNTLYIDPSKFSLKLTGTGYTETEFEYAYIDAAGKAGDPATYKLSWTLPLPITFTHFTVKAEGSQALLNWGTGVEKNNKGFEVQRSQDGYTWPPLFFVRSKAADGSSVGNLTYNYIDKHPIEGNNFYRLKQVDVDGDYNFSEVRHLYFDGHNVLTVSPNPTKGIVTIDGLIGQETIRVYNALGRLVLNQKAEAGKTSVNLTGSHGIYLIEVTQTGGHIATFRVAIK